MGTINLHRKMTNWEWFDDSFCVHIMCYMLLEAKKRESTFKGIKIKRGCVVAGRGKISDATGIPQQIVRSRMAKMIKSGDFSIEPIEVEGRKYSVIEITNYVEHQVEKKREIIYRDMPKKHTVYTDDFRRWWKIYKKGTKMVSFQMWMRCIEAGALPEANELIEITNGYLKHCDSTERAVADGSTFLNQRYFETDWTSEGQGTNETGERYDVFG